MEQKMTKDEMFDSIYRSCAVEVYNACLRVAKSEDLAQEMTQQAFVNFYERFEKVNPESAKSYLIRSAKNLLFNYFRDTKREVQDEEGAEVLLRKEYATESLEESYLREEKRIEEENFSTVILADLQKNYPNGYEVIYRIFYEDKSHDEIAEELGISKDVLYSRLRRVKNWIRKKYRKDYENM